MHGMSEVIIKTVEVSFSPVELLRGKLVACRPFRWLWYLLSYILSLAYILHIQS